MVDSYKIITKVGDKRNCWGSTEAEQLKEKEQNYGITSRTDGTRYIG
jgi:hypothetical protein